MALSGLGDIWAGMNWYYPLELLLSVIPVLICLTFHELCHGLAAYLLGDNTAKLAGRLTLNPIKHIDIFGFLMMLVFKFGWAKPVPVDMRRFRNPKRDMAITALCGPISNLVLACAVLFVYGLTYLPLNDAGGFGQTVSDCIGSTAFLSIALGVFNLIPIPPLDGSKVLFALLPETAYLKLMRYEKYGMILLLVAVSSGILGKPLGIAVEWLYRNLFEIAQFAFDLIN